MKWSLENRKIIKQIEELDLSAAFPYKEKQNLFSKKIQKKAKKRAKIVRLIRNDIKNLYNKGKIV